VELGFFSNFRSEPKQENEEEIIERVKSNIREKSNFNSILREQNGEYVLDEVTTKEIVDNIDIMNKK